MFPFRLQMRMCGALECCWPIKPAVTVTSRNMQVALQTAYFLGNMHWAESDRARLVLQLLGFPKVRGAWDLALVRPSGSRLSGPIQTLGNCCHQMRGHFTTLGYLKLGGCQFFLLQHSRVKTSMLFLLSYSQAVLPSLLCSLAAAAEAHAANGIGRPGSEPHLDHLDDSLRATYALVWAAGTLLNLETIAGNTSTLAAPVMLNQQPTC